MLVYRKIDLTICNDHLCFDWNLRGLNAEIASGLFWHAQTKLLQTGAKGPPSDETPRCIYPGESLDYGQSLN